MSERILLELTDPEPGGALRLVRSEDGRVFIDIDMPVPGDPVRYRVIQTRWEITRPVFADALAGALTDAFPITPFAGRPPS